MSDPIDTLMAALAQIDDDGNRVFPLDDVRHALPLIVMVAGLDVGTLSEGTQQLMHEAAIAAGLDPEADPGPSPEETMEAFATFFAENPVSKALLDEIKKAFETVSDGPSRAAQALLGTEKSTGVLGGGARPAGTIPASLSRLQSFPPKPKK